MRKYKYYCVMYIVKANVYYSYLVDYELNDYVYNLMLKNDIDYLVINKISLKEFINFFGNIDLKLM